MEGYDNLECVDRERVVAATATAATAMVAAVMKGVAMMAMEGKVAVERAVAVGTVAVVTTEVGTEAGALEEVVRAAEERAGEEVGAWMAVLVTVVAGKDAGMVAVMRGVAVTGAVEA